MKKKLIIVLTALLSFGGILAQGNPFFALRSAQIASGGSGAPGAQVRLEFDGNLTDQGGNTATKPEGSATPDYEASLNGQAMTCSGDDAVEVTDADMQTLSWSASIIFRCTTTGFQIGTELSREDTANHSTINIYTDGDLYMTVDDTNYQSTTDVTDGDWYHAIATYNHTTGAYALYLDGSLTPLVSGTKSTNSSTGNGKVYIGGRPDNSSEFLTGAVDMVAWWDRVLTTQEITDEFAAYNRTN